MEEVYSPIATEVHASNVLHGKQRPDKTLWEYRENFTDFKEKVMGVHPANITNQGITFLFIRNLYDRDIS